MYPAVPGPPTSLKAAVFDKTSVILSWSPPSNPNGVVLGFQVLYYGYKEQETSRVSEHVADCPLNITNKMHFLGFQADN